jgi:hypothetical protein
MNFYADAIVIVIDSGTRQPVVGTGYRGRSPQDSQVVLANNSLSTAAI